MKRITCIAPWLAAVAIGGAVASAPTASADTDPLVPYGTDPQVPYVLGYHDSNNDQMDTTGGHWELPF